MGNCCCPVTWNFTVYRKPPRKSQRPLRWSNIFQGQSIILSPSLCPPQTLVLAFPGAGEKMWKFWTERVCVDQKGESLVPFCPMLPNTGCHISIFFVQGPQSFLHSFHKRLTDFCFQRDSAPPPRPSSSCMQFWMVKQPAVPKARGKSQRGWKITKEHSTACHTKSNQEAPGEMIDHAPRLI